MDEPNGKVSCPLCGYEDPAFFDTEVFYSCENCGGIFKPLHLYPLPGEEKARYELHNNDIHDPRYQKFVSPITDIIFRDFKASDRGLDFGAGTGPVISAVLKKDGYDIRPYDPFFWNDRDLLKEKYDYIVCCEVIEHFHNPAREFRLLKDLLNPGGSLFIMTHLYDPGIRFDNWYYRNDETHVFIYREKTLRWIKKKYGFASLQLQGRLIRLYS